MFLHWSNPRAFFIFENFFRKTVRLSPFPRLPHRRAQSPFRKEAAHETKTCRKCFKKA
nr:MAG TPA: hypothetical protein [Caudoviricetes sp.]